MKTIRLTIGGCRTFDNYEIFSKFVGECIESINHHDRIIILSGHCKGTDLMAEKYAAEKEYEIEIYPADWKKYGRSAGPKRNREMVEKSDVVVAFWDSNSRGTKSLIEYANKKNVTVFIKHI